MDDVLSEGLEFYRAGNFDAALKSFKTTIKSIAVIKEKKVYPFESVEYRNLKNLELRAELNSSLACLKMKKFNDALFHAENALSLDERNIKGIFRKAVALKSLGRFSEARESIAILATLEESEAENLLESLNQAESQERFRAKSIWSGIFVQRSSWWICQWCKRRIKNS